ncbi:GYDIA family GHMP kinase [Gangjinia marincola]|uniref:GYDIA family GHMP kinase n=1 Tax=Gangjinia marincola TaxID=578463 RepID=UPI0031CF0373
MNKFYSNGKLLLTAEYLVLDGATALAIPTKKGQSLAVNKLNEPIIKWSSFLHDQSLWLEVIFSFEDKIITLRDENPSKEVKRLFDIFKTMYAMNDRVFKSSTGWEFISTLQFPKDWGLGSSSTLLNNFAQWAEIDAYVLLEKTFTGSGYDIASAKYNHPIFFSLQEKKPVVESVNFDPIFKDKLFFVHLNQKKSSREAIKYYRSQPIEKREKAITQLTALTKEFAQCHSLARFNEIIIDHEIILSNFLNLTTVKERLFKDYSYGSIKSLGGWGGDFILATGNENARTYFKKRGYPTVVEYCDMVL